MTKEELFAPALLARYVRVPEDDEPEITALQSLYLPAAIAHIMSHTGIEEAQIYEHAELSLAALALTAFLYDQRSLIIENDKANRVIESLINQHSVNLL